MSWKHLSHLDWIFSGREDLVSGWSLWLDKGADPDRVHLTILKMACGLVNKEFAICRLCGKPGMIGERLARVETTGHINFFDVPSAGVMNIF